MSRSERIQFPGSFHHIISRGNEKKDIFYTRNDYEEFIFRLKNLSKNLKILIHCYCLMSNHIHLLLELKKTNLSIFMQKLLGGYAMYFNNKYNRVGHLFQGRYKSYLIEDEHYFVELSRYIHLNPYRAEIIKDPASYEWSSMKSYIESIGSIFLRTGLILKHFKDKASYRKFILEGIASDLHTLPIKTL